MRTETITRTLYTFSELSDRAKDNALSKLYNINVDYDWWDSVYDGAANIGMEITAFDTGRGSYVTAKFNRDCTEIADAIIKDHGEICDTYKLATKFLEERDKLVDTWERDADGEFVNEGDLDDELDELEDEFKKDLEEEYLSILKKEYEYLTSEEAIIETLQNSATEYEFTEDGELA